MLYQKVTLFMIFLREAKQVRTRPEITLAFYFCPRRFKRANFNIKYVIAHHTPSETNKKTFYANVFVRFARYRASAKRDVRTGIL